MRIAVDFDGTLTKGGHNLMAMIKCEPDYEAIDKINGLRLKSDNPIHETIIYTARSRIFNKSMEQWLKKHCFFYTRIVFGKLAADLYIDNKSKRVSEL